MVALRCAYAPEAIRLAVLGTTNFGKQLCDCELNIGGGAQFGKTILELLLKTYLATVKFKAMMYCLPDDDLVQGIIDMKERPEVIDQIPYVGKMLKIDPQGLPRFPQPGHDLESSSPHPSSLGRHQVLLARLPLPHRPPSRFQVRGQNV